MYAISGDSDIKPIPVKGLLEEMFLKVRDSLSCNQYSILTVASTQRYSVQIVIFKWSALKQTCRFLKKKSEYVLLLKLLLLSTVFLFLLVINFMCCLEV